jgi:hypothetical protein
MKRSEYLKEKELLEQKIRDHIDSSTISMNTGDWLCKESDKISKLYDDEMNEEKRKLYIKQLKELIGRMDVELRNIFDSVIENHRLEEMYAQLENVEIEED